MRLKGWRGSRLAKEIKTTRRKESEREKEIISD